MKLSTEGEMEIRPASRLINLHGLFRPHEGSKKDLQPLMDLCIEAQEHIQRKKRRELARRKKEMRKLQRAVQQITPVLLSVFRGEMETSVATEQVFQLIPDPEMRLKAFERISESIQQEEDESNLPDKESASNDPSQSTSDKILKSSNAILDAISYLSDAVEANEPGAAEALAEAATNATTILTIAVSSHPERFKEAAAKQNLWPVLAKEEPGWEKFALNLVAKLQLGRDLSIFRSPLNKLRGSDVNLPARRWAKAAVRTIDETRWKSPFVMNLINKLGGNDAWLDFSYERNWDLADSPSWHFATMRLKPFSHETFDEWKTVVRQIIREQVPDFHLLPEWSTQRMTAEASGRNTPGEVQNAILDDIVSALKRFVPKS